MSISNNPEEILSQEAKDFYIIAAQYCKFLETNSNYSKAEIFNYLHRILPVLYIKGILLPDLDVFDDSLNISTLTEEEYDKLYDELKDKFEHNGIFWDIDNNRNYIHEENVLQLNLAEIICDIYQDMKNFVEIYKEGTNEEKQNAIYFCRYNFENDWGLKLCSILKLIHSLVYHEIDVKREI